MSGRLNTPVMSVFGVTACRHAVGSSRGDFGLVQLRLVRDVANHARLGAGAKQRALRTLEHFDAFEVGGVDVEVAAWKLAGLVIEIDRDVRKAVDRAARLRALVADARDRA